MTINAVDEMWSRMGGGSSTKDGRSFDANFVRAFQVWHSADATVEEILSHPDIPRHGDLYNGTFAICKSVNAPTRLSPIYSVVECNYDGQIGPNGLADNPLNKRPEKVWSDNTSNEPIDQDWDGAPIVTANGEPINGVTMELADQTLSIKRNFAAFSPWLTHQYRHSVNSDLFEGYAPGTARLIGFSATEQFSSGFTYWEVSARIQFRYPWRGLDPSLAWYARARHEGFYERIGSLVTFTGGGPTKTASGSAVVNAGGAVTSISIVNGGSGYSSAPSVSVADGSGFSGTAVLTDGVVTSVTVSSGGSGYKTRLVLAVDDNSQPVVKPVLLKIDGSRERNAANAYWFFVRRYGSLPYSALGLS